MLFADEERSAHFLWPVQVLRKGGGPAGRIGREGASDYGKAVSSVHGTPTASTLSNVRGESAWKGERSKRPVLHLGPVGEPETAA